MTLRVTYAPNKNLPVSDGAAAGVAQALVNEHNRNYQHTEYSATYSTWNVFERLRIQAVLGGIEGNLIFVYEGMELPVNADGTLDTWPIGMDHAMDAIEALFDAREKAGF